MSNNNLFSNRPMTSCMKIDGNMDLNNLSSLRNDSCHITFKDKQSESPGIYNLNQYRECDCGIPKVIETASSNPEVQFRDGYGVSECFIDDDTELRVGQTKKNPKCPIQLFTRPYSTVPYMGRGSGDSNVESQLRPGESTGEKRQCNTLAGVTISNLDPNSMPMIDHIRNSIQDPKHLITEEALNGWVRGGAPSRQIVRDIEYMEKCGSQYQQMAAKKHTYN
tara:strand:- start:187 stop:852 length:666 start_codon:yes stop_codon:yes gene_type:complete